MLRSLSTRLLLAFAFVIVLALGVSAVGTLFLLRDQQRDAAEERVGRLAEPLTLAVALLEEADVDQAAIQSAAKDYAESFDVRVLLVDDSGYVVSDTDSRLTGRTINVFHDAGIPVRRAGSAEFRMAGYDADGEDMLLFGRCPCPSDRRARSGRRATRRPSPGDLPPSTTALARPRCRCTGRTRTSRRRACRPPRRP